MRRCTLVDAIVVLMASAFIAFAALAADPLPGGPALMGGQDPTTKRTVPIKVKSATDGTQIISCPDGTCSGGGGAGSVVNIADPNTPANKVAVDAAGKIGINNTSFNVGNFPATQACTQSGAPWSVSQSGSWTVDVSDRVGRALGVIASITAAVDVSDRAGRLAGVVYGSQGQQLKQTATNFNLQSELAVGGTLIDPRSIRALTAGTDTVTISGSIGNTTFGATQGTSPWVTADNHITAAAPLSLRLSDGAAFYNAPTGSQLPAALDANGFLKTHEQGTAAISAASLPLPAGAATSTLQGAGLPATQDGGDLRVRVENFTLQSPNVNAPAVGVQVHAAVSRAGPAVIAVSDTQLLQIDTVSAGIYTTESATSNNVAMSQKAVAVNTTTNVKASAGNVYGASCANANASVCFLQFYNTSGSPTCGTAAVWSLAIPTSGVLNMVTNPPMANHATGIGVCMGTTATGATACTTANACTIFFK